MPTLTTRPGAYTVLAYPPRAWAVVLLAKSGSATVWPATVPGDALAADSDVDLMRPHLSASDFLIFKGRNSTLLLTSFRERTAEVHFVMPPAAPTLPKMPTAAEVAALVPVPEPPAMPEPPAPPDLTPYATRQDVTDAIAANQPDVQALAVRLRSDIEKWLVSMMPGWIRRWAPRRRGGGGAARMPAGASLPLIVAALPGSGFPDQNVVLKYDTDDGPKGSVWSWRDGAWVREDFDLGVSLRRNVPEQD